MTQQYGLKNAVWPHESRNCDDDKCGRVIETMDRCFIEMDNLYCDSCGKCLRYSRKKEAQRAKSERIT